MKSQNMKFCESYFQFQIFRIFWFSISAISIPSVGRWKILAKYLESLDFQIPKFTYSEKENLPVFTEFNHKLHFLGPI